MEWCTRLRGTMPVWYAGCHWLGHAARVCTALFLCVIFN